MDLCAVIPSSWQPGDQINCADLIAWQQWEGYDEHLQAILPVPMLPVDTFQLIPMEQLEEYLRLYGQAPGIPLIYRHPSEVHLFQLWLDEERGLQVSRSMKVSYLIESILSDSSEWLVGQEMLSSHAEEEVGQLCVNRITSKPRPTLHSILSERTAGLSNLGNTCFMNSALQCLFRVTPLMEYFLAGHFEADLNEENALGTGGQLAREWARLLKSYFSAQSAVSPSSFKWCLGRFEARFLGYNQQDSQELLSALLDRLHEDVNRVKVKPYTPIPDDLPNRSDQEIAEVSWNLHLARNDSQIVELLHGQYRSELVCPDCQTHSICMDPFCFLTLPLANTTAKKSLTFPVIMVSDDLEFEYQRLAVSAHPTVADLRKSMHDLIVEIYRSELYAVLGDRHLLDPSEQVVIYHGAMDGSPRAWVTLCHATLAGDRPFGIPLLFKLDPEMSVEECLQRELEKLFETSEHIHLRSTIPDPDSPFHSYHAIIPRSVLAAAFDSEETSDPHELFMSLLGEAKEEVEMPEHPTAIRLEDCLAAFRKPEQLSADESWYCRQCKEHVQAIKQMDLWRLPPFLFIHLKRFSQHGYLGHKISTPVQFPIEDFTPNGGKDRYRLIAVSEHFGSLGGGHYTALGRVGEGWCRFDDSYVRPFAELDSLEVQKSAYLLLYQRIE